MNKITSLLFFFALYTLQSMAFAHTQIGFNSEDGLLVTADLYESSKKGADSNHKTVIVLFHQAGSSRGEYREIAPKLLTLGYTALAVDQRSGSEFRGIKNETAARVDVGNDFLTALPDMRAAVRYARTELGAEKVIIWGSSYSASLSLILTAQQDVPIDAVLSFSPGEYFGNKINVEKEAAPIKVPTFITSARNEVKGWQAIFNRISSETKTAFKPKGKGRHGSSTLLSDDSEEYWLAIEAFLAANFK